MYMVLSATIGAASWPLFTARENVNRGCSLRTFSALSSLSDEKRVLAKFLPGIVHCPSSCGAFAGLGAVRPASGVGAARACPICSLENTSAAGTGAGTVCACATLAVRHVRTNHCSGLIGVVPDCVDIHSSTGAPRQEPELHVGEGDRDRETSARKAAPQREKAAAAEDRRLDPAATIRIAYRGLAGAVATHGACAGEGRRKRNHEGGERDERDGARCPAVVRERQRAPQILREARPARQSVACAKLYEPGERPTEETEGERGIRGGGRSA